MSSERYQEEFEHSFKTIKEIAQSEDYKMQKFINWVNEKAKTMPVSVLSLMTYENYLLFEKEQQGEINE